MSQLKRELCSVKEHGIIEQFIVELFLEGHLVQPPAQGRVGHEPMIPLSKSM